MHTNPHPSTPSFFFFKSGSQWQLKNSFTTPKGFYNGKQKYYSYFSPLVLAYGQDHEYLIQVLKLQRAYCIITTGTESIMVTYLINHVKREGNYAEVVDDHRLLEVKRFTVLHQARSERCDKVDVGKDDHGLRERGGHKEPVLNSWVYREIQNKTLQFAKFVD